MASSGKEEHVFSFIMQSDFTYRSPYADGMTRLTLTFYLSLLEEIKASFTTVDLPSSFEALVKLTIKVINQLHK